MKTLIGYFLLFALLFSACDKLEEESTVNYDQPFSTKVFVNDNGNLKAISKKDFLKEWENQVYEMQSVRLIFENPKIVEQENGTLILVVKSTDGTTKMATVVTLDGKGHVKQEGGSICTCTGCAVGCDPKHISGNKWECTLCEAVPPTCTKSVTASEPVPDGN